MGRMLDSEALQRPGNRGAGLRAAKPSANISRKPTAAGQPAASGPQVVSQTGSAAQTAFQRLAFRAGLAMLFVRITVLSELLVAFLHINTYLLWIVGPPAMFGTLLTRGVGRALRHPAARLAVGFFFCVLISLPFSSWVGGSVEQFHSYAENSFPLLFVVAGLTLTWSELRATFLTIGAAGIFIVSAARFLASAGGGRLEMTSVTGTIGNENDLASHVIFVLPFVLYIVLDRRIARPFKLLVILPLAYGMWVILGTASRGALISLAVCFLFAIFRGAPKQRLTAIVLGVVMAAVLPIMLQGNVADRLGSLFGAKQQEAMESQEARSYLLKQSLIFTVQHPVFGIGMEQFPNYEGKSSINQGKAGNWHETHNAFTQVSSECGIPALIFFVASIGSALASVNRIYRRARREGHADIANVAFCYLLSMIGYLTSIVFLSNAYRFYLPLMIGLAIALTATATEELSVRGPVIPALPPGWAVPVPARARVAQT